MGFDWRTADDAEVDLQYSPSLFSTRPLEEYLREYAQLSEPWVGTSTVRRGQPLLVYIHGGYWQRLSAAESLFNAADAAAHGVSLHAVEYTLAPVATVEQIVVECITEVSRVVDAAGAPRVALAGCSAGAHLVAMCAMSPVLAGRIDCAVLLSGIYDLRPLVRTPTNDPLGLDEPRAAALSPQLHTITRFAPHAVVAAGRHDPPEFIRQSAEFAEHLRASGVDTVHELVEDRDHFDLPYDLLRSGTVVGDHVLGRLRS
ncbi:MAG: alpha/beta hydrolase [Ilumatobacteraceae bacterium]